MKQIQKMIDEAGKDGVSIKAAVGYCIFHIGFRRDTAERYINELLEFGLIYRRGDKLYARKS